MSKLTLQDRNKLVKILESFPLLQTYRGRRQMLESAGLEKLAPQIDLEGSPLLVVSEITYVLESYGRVNYNQEALGVFLNTLKEYLSAGEENRDFIERILTDYNLMTPVKAQKVLYDWKVKSQPQEFLEKIIGENTLRHISFLHHGIKVSGAVAFIDVGKWTGTGFLISPNLLITNNHVLPDKTLLNNTIFRFNYQLTFDGKEEKIEDYKAAPSAVFYTNELLDYTVVELEAAPGDRWGYIRLNPVLPAKGDRMNIIQHPAGLPKQISFQNNFVEYVDFKIVQYLTSTLGGSSGSPVFNDQWQVVAIHHAGGLLLEPTTNQRYFRNEGITIGSILENLPESIQKALF